VTHIFPKSQVHCPGPQSRTPGPHPIVIIISILPSLLQIQDRRCLRTTGGYGGSRQTRRCPSQRPGTRRHQGKEAITTKHNTRRCPRLSRVHHRLGTKRPPLPSVTRHAPRSQRPLMSPSVIRGQFQSGIDLGPEIIIVRRGSQPPASHPLVIPYWVDMLVQPQPAPACHRRDGTTGDRAGGAGSAFPPPPGDGIGMGTGPRGGAGA
jgi:hypothetical protein